MRMKDIGYNFVYIAGPYRAKSHWQIELNVRQAEQAAYDLVVLAEAEKLPVIPICPHTMYRWSMSEKYDKYFLCSAEQLLLRSDSVLVVGRQWASSEGVSNEIKLASNHGMPIFWHSSTGVNNENRGTISLLQHIRRWSSNCKKPKSEEM
jgi:hypothetical protein